MIDLLKSAAAHIHSGQFFLAEIDLRVALGMANKAKSRRQAGYIICAITAVKRADVAANGGK